MALVGQCSRCKKRFSQGVPFYHVLWTDEVYFGPHNAVRSLVFCSPSCLAAWALKKAKPQ